MIWSLLQPSGISAAPHVTHGKISSQQKSEDFQKLLKHTACGEGVSNAEDMVVHQLAPEENHWMPLISRIDEAITHHSNDSTQ